MKFLWSLPSNESSLLMKSTNGLTDCVCRCGMTKHLFGKNLCIHLKNFMKQMKQYYYVCVYVNVFSFISPWNSSAFFHVIHIEERIKLKMKMSVWVRAVCIWNVHVHALCMYWLCACLCAWEKVTKNRT